MTNISRSIKKRFNRAYVKRKIAKMVGASFPYPENDRFIKLPEIDASSMGTEAKKRVLFVTPFYGPDASSLYSDFVLGELKKLGYEIHAVTYSDSAYEPRSPLWVKVFHLKSQRGSFGRPKAAELDGALDDLDGWAGNDLIMFVAALSRVYRYDVCISNYIFFSRVLDVQSNETLKVLLTHDVFANRNQRILRAGGSKKGLYFSISDDDEKRGVERADLAIAIQEEEARYFREIADKATVKTVPYCPPPKARLRRNTEHGFTIGYIASGHYPNVDAILSFLSVYKPAAQTITIVIAGSVCEELTEQNLPQFVKIIGRVDDVDDFYSECDVVINPDLLPSGLKVKCVEALSRGVPLICTKTAITGIGTDVEYHQLGSPQDVGVWCNKAAQDVKLLDMMATHSRKTYESFRSRYDISKVFEASSRLKQNA